MELDYSERKLHLKFEIVLNLQDAYTQNLIENRGSNFLGEAQNEAESWQGISWVSGTKSVVSRSISAVFSILCGFPGAFMMCKYIYT